MSTTQFAPDAIVLVHRMPSGRTVSGVRQPLFVCAEMFLELRDIEHRRWQMWSLRIRLGKAGVSVVALEDLLQPADIEWIERHSAGLSRAWYSRDGQDSTMYRQVSLGRCIEYEVKARLVRLLKFSRCMRRLLERFPGTPVFSDFAPESLEQRILNRMNVPTQHLHASGVSGAAEQVVVRFSTKLAATLGATGRRWGLVAFDWLAQAVRWCRGSSDPIVVVQLGLQSLNAMEAWLRSARRPPIRFAVWMDRLMRPREMFALVAAGNLVVRRPLATSVGDSHELASDCGKWASLFRPGCFEEGTPEAHLNSTVPEVLSEVALRAIPVARAAVDDGLVLLGQRNAALLALPNDCLTVTRAWTLVAQSLGKPSLVYQHGYLDYMDDGNHLTASFSAFWSEAMARQFQNIGLERARMLVTGAPNADACVAANQSRFDRSPHAGGAGLRRPTVLVITTGSPAVQAYIGETWPCDYIAGVLTALSARASQWTIRIKLHPGENGRLYQSHLDHLLPEGAALGDRGHLVRLLCEADVVITPPSTVVLEALACGTPVILLPIPAANNRKTALAQVEGVETLQSYEDLPDAIDRVLAGTQKRNPEPLPLSDYFGPLDGCSSKRLLEAIANLATSSGGTRTAPLKP